MKPDFRVSVVAGYLAMAAAIIGSVTAATFIDVQISLSRIDPNDSSTWPNMAPQVRYYFIPVFSVPLAVVAILVNLCLQLFGSRRFPRVGHWVLLGVAFSLVLLAFPLIKVGVNPSVAFFFAVATALSAVVLVRWRYGIPHDHDTV